MATQPQQVSPDDAPCSDIVSKDSKALQCNLCTGWIHIACADIAVRAYTTLQTMRGSMWLCDTCQDEFPNMPKKIATLADENRALVLQLEELSDLVKSMQKKLEALSEELDSTKGSKGWAEQRKRKYSSPLSITHIENTNRFALLSLNETKINLQPPKLAPRGWVAWIPSTETSCSTS